jgi:hypothetical protein
MISFFVNVKKYKKVNTIIQQNFWKKVIDKIINKDIKKHKESEVSWRTSKKNRNKKQSWNKK